MMKNEFFAVLFAALVHVSSSQCAWESYADKYWCGLQAPLTNSPRNSYCQDWADDQMNVMDGTENLGWSDDCRKKNYWKTCILSMCEADCVNYFGSDSRRSCYGYDGQWCKIPDWHRKGFNIGDSPYACSL